MPAFLYPLFLLAGLSLLIPVLIHLFNLRRYKTVFFPHTRFLQNITLTSRRQNEVRYKWLLALRLLLLAFLVLAFAQPFFNKQKDKTGNRALQVIYLDNSQSMTVKKGARTLLDVAKEAAARQIQSGSKGRYLIITNDRPLSYTPVPAAEALAQLQQVNESSASKTEPQILATIQSLLETEAAADGAAVFYYSDFQKNAFPARPDNALTKNLALHFVPVQAETKQNLYVDTAYLAAPVLQTGATNALIVRTRRTGDAPKEAPVLQLSINGQVKSAASLAFGDVMERIDTLSFSVNAPGWHRMELRLNDAAVRFDDTFRIAARSAPALSVLVLNESSANPFIQAAFRAYSGFQVTQQQADAAPADWAAYNLIILNGITHLDTALAAQCSKGLQAGQSIFILPARTPAFEGLNTGLKQLTDLRIAALDTSLQMATTLQQGSDLVRDLFERIPENVQLPTANWHYVLQSGLSASPQSVLAFRNGDPMLLKLQPARGQLYITAMSADLQGGNFPGSYFFVPFLYQMAVQSRGSDVYAITNGSGQAAFLPLRNADERNMIHAYGNGQDVIPPQRTSGGGLDVFLDNAVSAAGFYRLSAPGSDSVVVGFNASRSESLLDLWDIPSLQKAYAGSNADWQDVNAILSGGNASASGRFPLWKVCGIIALLLLGAETWVLLQRHRVGTPQAT